jgi:hypothetical protein
MIRNLLKKCWMLPEEILDENVTAYSETLSCTLMTLS